MNGSATYRREQQGWSLVVGLQWDVQTPSEVESHQQALASLGLQAIGGRVARHDLEDIVSLINRFAIFLQRHTHRSIPL
jgi:hypothetical protein